jgi:hypothetical protein
VNIGDNACHHIAVSYNAGTIIAYVDGVLVNTTNNFIVTLAATDFYSLGQEDDRAGGVPVPSQFYNGHMDEFRLWTDVRAPNEIVQNMDVQLAGNEADLEVYYDFNQGIPGGNNIGVANLTDVTNNNHDGVFNGGSTTASTWILGANATTPETSNFVSVICDPYDADLVVDVIDCNSAIANLINPNLRFDHTYWILDGTIVSDGTSLQEQLNNLGAGPHDLCVQYIGRVLDNAGQPTSDLCCNVVCTPFTVPEKDTTTCEIGCHCVGVAAYNLNGYTYYLPEYVDCCNQNIFDSWVMNEVDDLTGNITQTWVMMVTPPYQPVPGRHIEITYTSADGCSVCIRILRFDENNPSPMPVEEQLKTIANINEGVRINLFPNPTREDISIELESLSDLAEVSGQMFIYDASGSLVSEQGIDNVTEAMKVDVRSFKSGYYSIVLTFGDHRVNSNFIKQ